MSNTQSSVGSNAGKGAKSQCCTSGVVDLCATAADTVYDTATILGLLVAQGATHNDAANTPIALTDILHSSDVDLKGVDGEGQCWDGTAFNTEVATSCDAILMANGGQTNLDPGGSRELEGFAKNTGPVVGGYSLGNKFESVEVKQGSIVVFTYVICQDSELL